MVMSEWYLYTIYVDLYCDIPDQEYLSMFHLPTLFAIDRQCTILILSPLIRQSDSIHNHVNKAQCPQPGSVGSSSGVHFHKFMRTIQKTMIIKHYNVELVQIHCSTKL